MRVVCYKYPTQIFYANLELNEDGVLGLSLFLNGQITPISSLEIHNIVGGHFGEGCVNPRNYTLQSFMDEWEELYSLQGVPDVEVVQNPPSAEEISMALTATPNKSFDDLKTVRFLTDKMKMLDKIIRTTFVPKGGDKVSLNDTQLVMMVCLLFNRKINIPELILDCMYDMHHHKNRVLSYGKIVTLLLQNRGYVIPQNSEVVNDFWINEAYEDRMKRQASQRRVQGMEEATDIEGGDQGTRARGKGIAQEGMSGGRSRSMGTTSNQEILTAISGLERSMTSRHEELSRKHEDLSKKVAWLGKLQRKIGKHLGIDVSGFGACFGLPRRPKANGEGSETDST